MKIRNYILLTAIILLSSVNLLAQEPKTKLDSTSLYFEVTEHDFGTIKKGTDAFYNFSYTNNSKKPLIINNVETSCGCTTPFWSKKPMRTGEYDEISVIYDTDKLGVFHKTITVTSNIRTVVLTIKGVVIE